MDPRETDILFEHTRRLRTRTTTRLLIEEKDGKKPEYAWVRRKSKRAVSPLPARARSRSRTVGIGGVLF